MLYWFNVCMLFLLLYQLIQLYIRRIHSLQNALNLIGIWWMVYLLFRNTSSYVILIYINLIHAICPKLTPWYMEADLIPRCCLTSIGITIIKVSWHHSHLSYNVFAYLYLVSLCLPQNNCVAVGPAYQIFYGNLLSHMVWQWLWQSVKTRL